MQVVGDTLGSRIAGLLDAEHIAVDERVFPDGEVNFRILGEKFDKDVVVVMRKRMEENINSYLAKLYFLVRTLYREDCDIDLVMPYFAYARQDQVFRPGEPLSSEYVAQLFDPLVRKFITVTAHTHRRDSIMPMFSRAKALNVSGVPALAEVLPELDDVFVLGPDTESIVWAKEMAGLLGTKDYGAFDKERDFETGKIKITAKDFDLGGKRVVMVDDMVSTGGTTAKAAKYAKSMGAREVHMSFVHPVLARNALEILFSAGPGSVISTNTIESPVSVGDVSKLIAGHL